MSEQSRTNAELIEEISVLKKKNKELEQSESERNQAEVELRESEERYRTLVENASDIVFKTDDSGHCTFVNPVTLRITGYREEELIGKHYKMLVRPDKFKEAITFLANQLIKKIQNTYYEFPILTKEGHEIWLGQNTELIMEDGHVTGFQAVARDITERKQAEEALRESEEKSKAIANYTVNWESWFGPDGKYLWANPAVEKFTGYSVPEILAMPDFSSTVIAEEDQAIFTVRMSEAIGGSRAENFEFRYLHKNGTKRWLSAFLAVDFQREGQFSRRPCQRPRHHRPQAGGGGKATS